MQNETKQGTSPEDQGHGRRGRGWLTGLRLGTAALLLLVAGFWLGSRFGPHGNTAAVHHEEGPSDLGIAPSYDLTDQTGHAVSSSAFAGKVRVVTFLFPYCKTYCPLITAHLVGFEHMLETAGVQNQVQLVAFNLAPKDAGPAAMRTFLKQYGWNPTDRHWEYLTGTEKEIRHIVTDGYHVSYSRVDNGASSGSVDSSTGTPQPEVVNPLADKVNPGYDISHNDALVVVDRRGRIRRIFDQADVLSNQTLWHVVRPLLPKGAGAATSSNG